MSKREGLSLVSSSRTEALFPGERLQRAVEHFVAAGADARDRRRARHIYLHPDPLRRRVIRIEHTDAAEARTHGAGQKDRRHVAVRTRGLTADNDRAWRRAQRH